MLRSLFFLVAMAAAFPTAAQLPPAANNAAGDCLVRIVAAPATWLIQGYDPYGGSLPEATFGVTFVNDSQATCSFSPSFALQDPPFGLTRGTDKPVRYALLNLTNSRDATPRSGRTELRLAQREIELSPNEGRTILYKLVVNPDDLRSAGRYSQDVLLQVVGENFRTLGGARIVLGIDVLPSARIGLAGAFTMSDGHAVVDLGELRPGQAQVPLQLRVSSTSRYELSVTSANSGRLRLGSSDWYVPYTLMVGGNGMNLQGPATMVGSTDAGLKQDSLPIQFFIGDVSNRRAGVYNDVISITITAR